MASSFDRLRELNLTRDEVNRLGEALKKEEFRTLLSNYVEELQDPKNKQIYENEVKQLEKERGQDVTFLHPTPGYVIKTSINECEKCFINICSNENIHKPSSSPSVHDGVRGLQWSLPHSLSPSHEEIDNKGTRCQVFDVLFHPDTLHLASKNASFRSMVNNVALEALESNYGVILDKKNLKFPKMSFKGLKRASILREPSKDAPIEHSPEEKEIFNKIFAEIDSQRNVDTTKSPKKVKARRNSNENFSVYTTPKYLIKHRSHIDMQECIEHRDAKLNTTVPKELVIEIDLPLLKTSSDMSLDVTEKTVHLVSEKSAKYKLNLTLPYQVNEASGTAKFDKDLKKLVITLPVKQKNVINVRDDSGVESCFDSDPNSPTSPESEEDDEHKLISVIENSVVDGEILKSRNKQFFEHSAKIETPLGTNISDNFLNASDLYNIPEFTCNVFDNIVAFTLAVKNVDENSVVLNCCPNDSLIKLKFTSVSASFYPSYYSFYVKFPQHTFIQEEVNFETWDNNVILQIPFKPSNNEFISYFCGSNEKNLTKKFVEEPAVINRVLEKSIDDRFLDSAHLSVDKQENFNVLNTQQSNSQNNFYQSNSCVKENQNHSFKEIKGLNTKNKTIDEVIDILATSYESSGDELSSNSFSPRKNKGILKHISMNRTKFGRSVSESSLDDLSCSFENYHRSIECVPEDVTEDEVMSSSLKKTVRFNDNISKQLYRSNSSILGQKKKNQRKARNKKRAQERRYSESEASDFENKKEGDGQTTTKPDVNVQLDTHNFNKRDDADIFHLEINN